MKIKLDENLPLQIAAGLAAFGHDVHTVCEENITGSKDHRAFTTVWRIAASQIDSRQVWGVQSETNLKECVRERDERNHIDDWTARTGMPPANRLSSAPE